jgi:hypothetical protein
MNVPVTLESAWRDGDLGDDAGAPAPRFLRDEIVLSSLPQLKGSLAAESRGKRR